MANWGVVSLARRPVLHNVKRSRILQNSESANLMTVEQPQTLPVRDHAHIFKHLCESVDSEHDCAEMGCERITINVSGLQFVTKKSILEAHPTTVLGDPEKRNPYYDHIREEYFFDRHRATFESIFNYYIYGGKLKKPAAVADDVFLDECEFFEVEENVLLEYKKEEGYTETTYEYPFNPLMAKVWALFEYPETSRPAFIIGIISVVATLLSIVTFTLETLPDFTVECSKDDLAGINANLTSTTIATPQSKLNSIMFFFVVESLCNIWFTLEAVVRFISCPNHLLFWKDIKNIIDIIAIVPYYVSVVGIAQDGLSCAAQNSFAFLRVIRLIRVFKLTKHSQGLQILLLTFQSSIEGLTLFFLTLLVCVLVFSSMIYYCEIGEPETKIHSIPGGFWWALITMCTVGYGDVHPVGLTGKLVGTVCALSGVLTLAIPVPIITENFNKFYIHKTRSRSREKNKGILDRACEQISVLTTKCRYPAQDVISTPEDKYQTSINNLNRCDNHET